MDFSVKHRAQWLDKASSKTFDVLIIGGGITGAGIALDCASRGLSVCLLEMQDFGAGTSSRSTKLIHGGLRYLKQFDFKLVRDTGTERAIAYQNAPHLVTPAKMLLPMVKKGTYGKFMLWLGLSVYDRLARVSKKERKKILSKKAALEKEPLLKPNTLKGAGYYTEYQVDDARLTLSVLKTAVSIGAVCINYAGVNTFIKDENNQITGVHFFDQLGKQQLSVKAKRVVSACGPWSDEVRTIDDPKTPSTLYLTKGVHLVFAHKKLPIRQTVYFDEPKGRMVFAIPKHGKTYVGTTDTHYKGELANPQVSLADQSYLLEAIHHLFEVELTAKDVLSTWAGIRPLIQQEGKSASEISRKDEVFVSPSGLITIAGGKLTGYRLMAKKVTDLLCDQLDIKKPCQTKNQTISGGDLNWKTFHRKHKEDSIDKKRLNILFHRYGSNLETILNHAKTSSLLEAEIAYSIHHEMTTNLEDFFGRRTSKISFAPNEALLELETVARIFAQQLDWSNHKMQDEIMYIKQAIKKRTTFV